VVASDVASNPELVADALVGYLCPVDEAEAYAAALRRLAASRSTVAAMGLHNRRVVLERHELGTMVENYKNIFSAVLGGADRTQS
jgi:glycosyltransferase involved in cell wall biosynthesis